MKSHAGLHSGTSLIGNAVTRLGLLTARIATRLFGHRARPDDGAVRSPPEAMSTSARSDELVDQASEDSFPASDPPAWTSRKAQGD